LTIKFTQATSSVLAREACRDIQKGSRYSISEIPNRDLNKFSGDFVDRVTPVPIPNTEVKPVGADGTARETAWESRKSPGLIQKPAREFS
jgi:hypothetical protein